MSDVRLFRKRVECATNVRPCASCGVIPDPTHHVSLPFASGANMREMTDSERKTTRLLEPLTIDRRDDGTFDPDAFPAPSRVCCARRFSPRPSEILSQLGHVIDLEI